MTQNEQTPERRRRRDWLIILLLLLLGFCCVIFAGQWAVRFAPNWRADVGMDSNIDPNSQILTNEPEGPIEPLDKNILTPPSWLGLFLTPGALGNTPTPLPPVINSPVPTTTFIPSTTPRTPTVIPTNTPVIIYVPPTKTPVPAGPSANLMITMSDGSTTYNVGGTITYTITVYNISGPNAVTGATVTDSFPADLINITWTCAGSGGGVCTANGTGNINDLINLPVGSSVTFTVNADVSASATGNLSNTATVTMPVGVSDPNLANNTVTDVDTPLLTVDLQITKTDGVTTYVANGFVTYTIVVSNPTGPSDVVNATVADTFPSQISSATWICVPTGAGASCAANGSGNISDATVDLPVGTSVTYTVNANIGSPVSGTMSNTATVAAPAGVTETNLTNNSATDDDTYLPAADLAITKDDGVVVYVASTVGPPVTNTVTYIVTVSNNGPDDVIGAVVSDNRPSQIATWSWACTTVTNASGCDPAGPSGANFSDTVDIQNGGSIVYTVTANISTSPSGNLVNTATVSGGVIDPVPGNNSDTDTDELAETTPHGNINIGGPDYSNQGFSEGESLVLLLPTPLVIDGNPDVDLIYYEELNGGGVALDWVIIEIGDGTNWYTVFNWGNGASDSNTNVAIPLVGNGAGDGPCIGEPDNCQIDGAILFNTTGITIDIDALGYPAGSYPYLRIYAPPGGDGDGVAIDGFDIP